MGKNTKKKLDPRGRAERIAKQRAKIAEILEDIEPGLDVKGLIRHREFVVRIEEETHPNITVPIELPKPRLTPEEARRAAEADEVNRAIYSIPDYTKMTLEEELKIRPVFGDSTYDRIIDYMFMNGLSVEYMTKYIHEYIGRENFNIDTIRYFLSQRFMRYDLDPDPSARAISTVFKLMNNPVKYYERIRKTDDVLWDSPETDLDSNLKTIMSKLEISEYELVYVLNNKLNEVWRNLYAARIEKVTEIFLGRDKLLTRSDKEH